MSVSFTKSGIVAASGIEVGENLIINSTERIFGPSEAQYNYLTIVTGLTIGETYTFSAVVELDGTDYKKCTIFNYNSSESSTDRPITRDFIADGITRDSWTFTAVNTSLIVYAGNAGGTSGIKATYKYAKLELGSIPTPWIPNVNDYGVVPTSHGFSEQNTLMGVHENYITTPEFIEY